VSSVAYTVGVIGAGPGVAALHLPTLARFDDLYRVVAIADGGSGRGQELAERAGAAYAADAGQLASAAGEPLDVVLVASPPHLHAAHVRHALAAGARGILCEKPLATSAADARDIVATCRERGVALVVGTNHLYDPAWARTTHHLRGRGGRVESIRVVMSLAPNDRYHRLVTDDLPPVRGRAGDGPPPAAAHAGIVRQLLQGLAIHDLPAVRDLAPLRGDIRFARFVPPLGYAVAYDAGGIEVQLAAVMRGEGDDTRWRMTVSTAQDTVDVDFPPPFVHPGSATVRVREADGRVVCYPRDADDGYDGEWQAMGAMLNAELAVEYDELLADIEYALDLAEAAASHIEKAAT
jgi:predicted dehydrogenase